MSKIYHSTIISVLLLLFISCSPTKQIGKFYTPEEANKLFGNVIYSVDLSTNVLSELLKQTEKSIMFGLVDRQLIILDNHRNLIYPDKAEYKDTDIFTVYSIDVVTQLISNRESGSQSENVSVEQRREVLSISSEISTLEMGLKCPPLCPD